MGVGESPPLAGKPIDIRCLDPRSAVAAEVTITEIVGENEDDVVSRSGRSHSTEQRNGVRKEQGDAGTQSE